MFQNKAQRNFRIWRSCALPTSALHLSNHTNEKQCFGFCLHAFRQAGPPQRVDCLAPMGNRRKVSFPRTQRRIAS